METVQLLANIPLFQELDGAALRQLDKVATKVTLSAGARVFSEGTPGDSLFVISYGTVQVLKRNGSGTDEEIARMGSGGAFGEMALIDTDPRSATVCAVEHTELFQIKRADLDNLLDQDPTLGFHIYKTFARYLCGRLRRTSSDLTFMREVARRGRD